MMESICTLLMRRGALSESQVAAAIEAHRTQPEKRIDRLLVELRLASESAVLEAMAEFMGLRYVDLSTHETDAEAICVVPAKLVYQYNLFPVARHNGTVTIATDDPLNTAALDEVRVRTGLKVEPVLAASSEIEQQIKRHFGVGGETVGQLVTEQFGALRTGELLDEDAADEMAEEASVVRLVNEILTEAVRERASDVHIEPEENGLHLRYRIDGVLQQQSLPSELKRFRAAIVSRLKIMSRLNIAEKRLPQDGRIKLRVENRDVDIRVSIIPMLHGEGVVLRILDRGSAMFSLQEIGMDDDMYAQFRSLIELPHGIILVTGPTGSGKSTTLYSALCEIKDDETKIITIEDPVEYHINGISQIQVQSKIGLTFATALRSILRHDPDVVLVGEIRDRETAEIAIEAAMTGHVVFSTLHTNDAASAFARLTDMGIEPYLAASSIEGVLAQRLVRVICPSCKLGYAPGREDVPPDLPLASIARLHRGAGCRQCRGTGYAGRTGIYELLVPNPAIRQMIMERANSADIQAEAIRCGMVTLRTSGTRKVLEGTTTLEEVARVTKADEQPSRKRGFSIHGSTHRLLSHQVVGQAE